MKVRIIDNGSYVNLKHIVGKVYDAVKVNGYYSGYYVEVPISKNKTTSLYFLPYELEEVEEVVNDCEKRLARTSFVVILIAIIAVIVAICNQIIN